MDNAKKSRLNTLLIPIAYAFIFFGFGTAQQYLIVLFSEKSEGDLALLSLLLLYGAFLLSGIIVTKLIPRLGGLKRSLVLGAFTYAVFVASVAGGNTTLLLAASLLVGVGASLLWVSSGAIITDSSNDKTVGRNFAAQMIGMYTGNILGINVGAYFVDILSLRYFYLFLTVMILIGVALLLFVSPVKEETTERPFRPGFIFDKRMLAIFPVVFGTYVLQAQVFTAMNLVVIGLLGANFIAFMVTVIKISNIVGSFGSGALSARVPKQLLLLFFIITALVGLPLFLYAHTLAPLVVGMVFLGFSMSAIYPATLAWLKERFSAMEYLYALGTFHIYTNLGVVSTIVANRVFHSNKSFLLAAVALALAFPGILLFNQMTKKTNETAVVA